MSIHTTITGNIVSKKENFLVNTFVFFTFWSFFTGFPIAFNGVFRTMLGGRLGMLLMLIQFQIYLFSYNNTPRSFSKINQKYAFVFGASFLFIWLWILISISEFDSGYLTPLLNVPFFILLRDDLKVLCLDRFIRILAIILALSLLEHIVFLIFHKGILVSSGIGRTGFEDSLFYDFYDQYILNIYFTGRDLPRFQCLCEEPGCIGTLCGFLLYVTKGKKDYKKQYFIFMIAGFFSFSLAFFALFVLHLFLNSNLSPSTIIVLLVLYFLATYIFVELFQNLFLARFAGGYAEADDRVQDNFRTLFVNAWKNGELWLPHGTSGGTFGAGAIMWIWGNGIIALIIIFFSYFYIFWCKVKILGAPRWECLIFFIAFWMSFYQRHWITNLDYLLIYLTIPVLYSYYSNNYTNIVHS